MTYHHDHVLDRLSRRQGMIHICLLDCSLQVLDFIKKKSVHVKHTTCAKRRPIILHKLIPDYNDAEHSMENSIEPVHGLS